MVGINWIGGLRLHIKKASNDLDLGYINTNNYSENSAIFDLSELASILLVGDYYKIQIAYLDGNLNVGYYSTISLVKYTVLPTVMISSLSEYSTNYNPYYLTGVFNSIADPSEKSHEYKFSVYDADLNLIETSDWQIHNHNLDTLDYESTDNYMIKHELELE